MLLARLQNRHLKCLKGECRLTSVRSLSKNALRAAHRAVRTNREISARNALRLGAQKSQARVSNDDRTSTASEDVTHALQRTVALMSSELDKSGYSAQLLEESSATIATVSESYVSFRDMLRNSVSVIRSMERAEMIDFGILAGAILFFVGCVMYVLHVRVISRGVWVLNILWNMVPGSAGPTLTSAVGMFASSTAPHRHVNIAENATPDWGSPLEHSKHARRTRKDTTHTTEDSGKVTKKATTKGAAEKATTNTATQKVAAENAAENTAGAEAAAKQAAKERAAKEKAEAEAAAKKAAAEKAAAEKAEAEAAVRKLAEEKEAAEKAQAEAAKKNAAEEEVASAMKEAEVNAVPVKEATEKAASDKAAVVKAAAETAAVQKAAEEAATGKETAESVVDKGAAENAAPKETTRSSKKTSETRVPEAGHSSEAHPDTTPDARIDTSQHSSAPKIPNWTHDEL